MTMTKEKRKKLEEVIITTYKLLDPSELNSNNIKETISKMSDKQFDTWIRNILYNEKNHFRLTVIPHQNDLKQENIQKAADYLNVPLFERVSMPYINPNGEVYQTQEKVPVGYLIIKRPEQLLSKKNGMSIHIDQRDPLTGQVVNKSKFGRVTDMENIALVTKDAPKLAKEFLSLRSDDLVAKSESLKQIKNNGYLEMDKIVTSKKNKIAINTMDVYFTSCGIKTNLITNSLALPRTEENIHP